MKNRAHLLPTLAASAILGALPCAAQERPAAMDTTTISVDFAGGTLADLVEVIRGAGENINILIPPEAGQVTLPALTLKQVTVEAALNAISEVASNRTISVHTSVQRQPPGYPVFSIRVNLDPSFAPRSGTRFVEVYSIRGLTESMPGDPEAARMTLSSETILTAIDTGLDVSAEGQDEPVIRYHEESGLLFVRANGRQHELINDVIRNLSNDLEGRRIAARRAGGQPGARRGGRQGR